MKVLIRKILLVGSLIFSVVVLSTWVADAQNDRQSASEVIKKQRKIYIEKIMELTPQEKKTFWPLYAEYESGLSKIREKRIKSAMAIVQNHDRISDAEAISMLKQKLKIDVDELKYKLSYVTKFMQVLPGRKVARFYQVENKFDTAAIFKLYRNIPVIR